MGDPVLPRQNGLRKEAGILQHHALVGFLLLVRRAVGPDVIQIHIYRLR